MNYGQREAAIDAAAIGQHGACATLSVIATFFSAGKLELLPQKIKERKCADRAWAVAAFHWW
jgi:hypothetical protein